MSGNFAFFLGGTSVYSTRTSDSGITQTFETIPVLEVTSFDESSSSSGVVPPVRFVPATHDYDASRKSSWACNGLSSSRVAPRRPFRQLDESARRRHNWFNAARRRRNRACVIPDLSVSGLPLVVNDGKTPVVDTEFLQVFPTYVQTCEPARKLARDNLVAGRDPFGPAPFSKYTLTPEPEWIRSVVHVLFASHARLLSDLRRCPREAVLSPRSNLGLRRSLSRLGIPSRLVGFVHLMSLRELHRCFYGRVDVESFRKILIRRQRKAARLPADIVSVVSPHLLSLGVAEFYKAAARVYAKSLLRPKWRVLTRQSRLRLLSLAPRDVQPDFTKLGGPNPAFLYRR